MPWLSAFALTTNVSAVAELAGAITALNEKNSGLNELVLQPGRYAVDDLNLQYWHATYKCWTNSNAHIGLTKFTLRGATGNPSDVVIYLENPQSNVGLVYSYSATIRDVTLSNCTCSAYSACGNVNGGSNYSNVVVTCCSSKDGGGATSGTWRDCRFVNCTASRYGGAVYAASARLYGCTIENCTATTDGGASHAAILTDCTIRNCSSATGGGACMGALTNCWVEGCSATSGGGVARATLYGSTVTNCTATGTVGGGGVYVAEGVIQDCVIVGNAAANGGGAYQSSLSNCLVACNHAMAAGGGVYGSGSVATCSNYVLTDCVVSNNLLSGDGSVNTYGAGAAYVTIRGGRVTMNRLNMADEPQAKYGSGGGTAFCFVEDVWIDGNALTGVCKNFQGGGDYSSTLMRCVVANNVSTTLGGGICGSTVENCVISNNVSLSTASAAIRNCALRGCLVYGCSLDPQNPVVGTRIMGYTNGNVIAKGANVLTQEAATHYPGTTHLVISRGAFTNCLFTGQRMQTPYCALVAASKTYETILSSCTVANNWVEYTHAGYTDESGAHFTAVNCVFSDNYTGNGSTASDLRSSFDNLLFDHCLVKRNYSPTHGTLTACITDRPAAFAFAGDEPFLLKWTSPALGTGLPEDWMVGAYDLRGKAHARLSNGKVNMGCFEGFFPGAGTCLILR